MFMYHKIEQQRPLHGWEVHDGGARLSGFEMDVGVQKSSDGGVCMRIIDVWSDECELVASRGISDLARPPSDGLTCTSV